MDMFYRNEPMEKIEDNMVDLELGFKQDPKNREDLYFVGDNYTDISGKNPYELALYYVSGHNSAEVGRHIAGYIVFKRVKGIGSITNQNGAVSLPPGSEDILNCWLEKNAIN